jgi:hypothetical protein
MNFRFSGHETFQCRYTWLPKAVDAISKNPRLFADEDAAMVTLGVGKNMVRSIRFWSDASEVAVFDPIINNTVVSDFGNAIFGPFGYDRFLEDIKTLWLIHWKLATNVEQPLFAWHFLINSWHRPDFTRSEMLNTFKSESQRIGKSLSIVTLENHFTTFLHSYIPTRGRKGEVMEDNLDCPLVELELIREIGERTTEDTNRRESIYAFRVDEKPEISPELFIFCLNDFWLKYHQNEKTLSFRELSVGVGSPGQVLKLPEKDIRERLEMIEKHSTGRFAYNESAALQQVTKQKPCSSQELIRRIYQPEN